MDPELSCMSARNKAEGYGELSGGYVFKCSIGLAHSYVLFNRKSTDRKICRLLADDCVVLHHLGKVVPFEIAVGMNGKVWVNSASKKHTILICNAILNSEFLQPNQIQSMVAKLSSFFSATNG